MMDEVRALVQYRMESAREAMEDARLLAQNQRWRGCVNRLYYAAFYAVSALLESEGLSSSKHSGIRSLFNRHFVKPARVSKEAGELYNTLYESRQESDYADYVSLAPEQILEWLERSDLFANEINGLLVDWGKS